MDPATIGIILTAISMALGEKNKRDARKDAKKAQRIADLQAASEKVGYMGAQKAPDATPATNPANLVAPFAAAQGASLPGTGGLSGVLGGAGLGAAASGFGGGISPAGFIDFMGPRRQNDVMSFLLGGGI